MGYRSDVVALMYVSKEGDVKAEVAMIREFIRSRVDNYTDREGRAWLGRNFTEIQGGMMFKADHWKWYDSYPEIQFLTELFDEYQECFMTGMDSNPYCYEFVRVGEEIEDNHVEWSINCEQRLDIARSITYEGGDTP